MGLEWWGVWVCLGRNVCDGGVEIVGRMMEVGVKVWC